MKETMTSIQSAVEQCANTAASKGFHQAHNEMAPWRASQFAKLALIHSEVSEACEELRDAPTEEALWTPYPGESGKPIGYLSELADIVIRVFDLVGEQQVNFDALLQQKMNFNANRPALHGRQA